MCRKNQLFGWILMAFGWGVLVGSWITKGFFCFCFGFGMMVLGCCILRRRV